eukprot:1871243-Prymnesium_polylepis.1
MDTIVLPQNLHGLLNFLHSNVQAGARVYFGKQLSVIGYKKCGAPGASKVCLRSTDAWLQMEAAAGWNTSEGERVLNATPVVRYMNGGAQGWSRAALAAVVQSRCMQDVARIRCAGFGKGVADAHRCE